MKRSYDDYIANSDLSITMQVARDRGIIVPGKSSGNGRRGKGSHYVEGRSLMATISNTDALPEDVVKHILEESNLASKREDIDHIIATREPHSDGKSNHIHIYIHAHRKVYLNSETFKSFSNYTHVGTANVQWLHYIMKTFERKEYPFGYKNETEIGKGNFHVYGKIGRELGNYNNVVRYANDSSAFFSATGRGYFK